MQKLHVNDLIKEFCPNRVRVDVPVDDILDKLAFDKSPFTKQPYREVIGKINHIANHTRPDLSHALSVFARYSHSPRETHWNNLMRVVRYINYTKDQSLVFGPYLGQSKIEICVYTDSNHASESSDKISQGGFFACMNGSVFTWKSTRLHVRNQSSTESELLFLCAGANKLKWLSMFVNSLKLVVEIPFKLYCDNMAAITSAVNPDRSNNRLKHVDIKTRVVKNY